LLTEDKLLELLYDKEQIVSSMADTALKARGLTVKQIELGKTMVNPDPKVRATVIAQLDGSMDIDPAVWLARLVEDKDAEIRLKAVEAIARRKVTGELKRKLQVISDTDSSDAVRKSAEKILRSETTASAANSLSPLPSPVADAKPATKPATIRAN
ncbi:MAG: HEAT repeat domain-containing protein, partial [bacterium]